MEDVNSAPLIWAVKLLSRDASSHQITMEEVLYITMHFSPHQGQLHTHNIQVWQHFLAVWGLGGKWTCCLCHIFWLNLKSKLAQEKLVTSAASWATCSSPGQDSCSSTHVFVCFSNWPGCRNVPPHCWHTEPATGVLLSFCPAGSALES